MPILPEPPGEEVYGYNHDIASAAYKNHSSDGRALLRVGDVDCVTFLAIAREEGGYPQFHVIFNISPHLRLVSGVEEWHGNLTTEEPLFIELKLEAIEEGAGKVSVATFGSDKHYASGVVAEEVAAWPIRYQIGTLT